MARSLFRDTICLKGPAGLIPLSGAEVRFYEPDTDGTLVPIGYPLYPDGTSTAALPVPFNTGAMGELELWADAPHRVRIVVSKPGYGGADEVIQIDADSADFTTESYVDNAVTDHTAESDPHTQYLTPPRGDLRYLPLGTYIPDAYTKTQSDARYLPLGTVIPDAYTKVQSDARYLPINTPIPDAYTKTQSDARYEPLDSAYTKTESDGRYVLATAPTPDNELRLYIQSIMTVLDPGGPPPPSAP